MNSKEKVEKFLDYLEEQLELRNITVPRFAKMMGLPKSTVYSWLNRVSVMSLEKYYRALQVLGIKEKLIIARKTKKNNKDK